MKNLNNKKIIVTGATGGIGQSIVKSLSENGAKVLATGTKNEKLDKLKAEFKNIEILKFDISDTSKIEEFIENAFNKLGGNSGRLIPIEQVVYNLKQAITARSSSYIVSSPFETTNVTLKDKELHLFAFITFAKARMRDLSSISEEGEQINRINNFLLIGGLFTELNKREREIFEQKNEDKIDTLYHMFNPNNMGKIISILNKLRGENLGMFRGKINTLVNNLKGTKINNVYNKCPYIRLYDEILRRFRNDLIPANKYWNNTEAYQTAKRNCQS